MSKKIKVFIFCLTLVFSSLAYTKPAQADHWGAAMLSQIWKQTMEKIDEQIKGVIMGALKTAANEMLNNTVDNLISGGGSRGSLIISNPHDFLYTQPDRKAALYMNDFFTLTTRGTSSMSNYATRADQGTVGNYSNYLVRQAKLSIEGAFPRTDIQQYASDPSQMFAQGNWRGFNAFISNPANNPFGLTLIAQSVNEALREQFRGEAASRYAAGKGYADVEKNGQIVTPGSTIASIQEGAKNLGNQIIAAAQNPAEVISSVLAKIVTKTMLTGIGMAQRTVQREITNVTSGVRRDVNQTVQSSGPGAIFQPRY